MKAEDRDYGIAVVAKQKQLSTDEAADVFAGLAPEAAAALVEHGRAGQLAEVHAILAGPTEEPADKPAAKSSRGKKAKESDPPAS